MTADHVQTIAKRFIERAEALDYITHVTKGE